jgi:hypothetical protein
MALGSALVDRARIVRNRPQPQRVDGRTEFAKVSSSWFRCRLTVPARPRNRQGNVTRSESHPTLLYEVKNADGDPVGLTGDDEVEVVAAELGDAAGLFKVDGEPEPLRKRRTVIGFQVPLKRIEAREFQQRPGVR